MLDVNTRPSGCDPDRRFPTARIEDSTEVRHGYEQIQQTYAKTRCDAQASSGFAGVLPDKPPAGGVRVEH
jgi:hypothetical protein